MDVISRNSDDGSIKLADPIILSSETLQKDNPHLGKAMKSDDRDDFMKAMENRNKIFYHRRCLVNSSKIIASNFITHNPIHMELQNKNKLS